MKISKLIKKLQEIQEEHGDLYVWVNCNEINDNNFGFLWNAVNIENLE